jgi:hypothetical protein
MPLQELEKAWAARAPFAPLFVAPTFVGDKLTLGAETVIAIAGQQGALDEARMAVLIAAFYRAPASERTLRHLQKALERRAEGDALSAATHLALAGFWPSREPLAAARRAFLCDGLLKEGAPPRQILAAIGFAAPPLGKYNPNIDEELRVPRHSAGAGQWTRGGGTDAAVSGAVPKGAAADEAPLTEDAWSFAGELPQATVRALLRLFARSSVATILFDTLFVPDSGHSAVVEGGVQGRDDLRYTWDKPVGRLSFRAFIGGRWLTLTGGTINPLDQIFYDADGNPIARIVGDAGIVADLRALDRARETLTGGKGDQPPSSRSSNDSGRPRLCPDPTPENTRGRSSLSLLYQEYVSGLPAGLDIKVGTVRFDGCKRTNGFLLEAKANYVRFLDSDGQWKTFFLKKGVAQLEKQLKRQSAAAALVGREVEWHILQKPVADKLRQMVKKLGIENIEVIFDPGPWR